MLVKILRDTIADGRPVFAGNTETVSDADGRLLMRLGKAVETTDDPLDDGGKKPAKGSK